FGAVCTEEPFERVEGELLDREYGEGTCTFAALLPADTFAHEKPVCALLASLQLRFRQARLPDAHRFCEFRDQELILIVRAHLSLVGDPKGRHRQRAAWDRRIGVVRHRHHPLFLPHCPLPSKPATRRSMLRDEHNPATNTPDMTRIHL